LVRRLIAGGINAFDIRAIFATGIHRQVTANEKDHILTPFIAQRINSLDHDARDLARIVRLGETSGGIPIELNRALVEHDQVILVGGVSFHYFAGFTGGRKLVCPGLASSQTISATHRLAFDHKNRTRASGVGTGQLDGNPVHEAFVEVVEKISPAFAVNAIVDGEGRAIDVFCGDWLTSHRAACDEYSVRNTIQIAEKRPLVVVGCGGAPFDVNLIQAHKALEAASKACSEGGSIVFLAECAEGTGRKDFLDWFGASNSEAIAERLCERYQVNGQTAWSLLRKTERFKVHIVTALDRGDTEKMRFIHSDSLTEALKNAAPGSRGYIIPNGAAANITSA
jgi:lactate racemase